jgi:hypothetical protein
MDFSNNPPIEDYVTKLLLLELVMCTANEKEEEQAWLEKLLQELARAWADPETK